MKQLFLFFAFTFSVYQTHAQKADRTFTVYFSTDSYHLSDSAKFPIDSLANYLNSLESYSISLSGYCDIRGSSAYNLKLAQKRVATVQQLLLSKKIPVKEIQLIGENYDQQAAKHIAYSQYRKVEISVHFSASTKKQPFVINNPEKTNPEIPVKSLTDSIKYIQPLSIEKVNLEDIKAKKNNLVVLQIEFYPGTTVLTEESLPELEKLRKFLKENKEVHAFIRGHVCCGSDYPLSSARANFVMRFLIDKGIKKDRLSAKGFDNTIPAVYPEITEEDKQRNRRIDVIFFIPEN